MSYFQLYAVLIDACLRRDQLGISHLPLLTEQQALLQDLRSLSEIVPFSSLFSIFHNCSLYAIGILNAIFYISKSILNILFNIILIKALTMELN